MTPQGKQSLEPGTTLIADGAGVEPREIQTQPAIALDDFDAYNGERDDIYLAAAESQYGFDSNWQHATHVAYRPAVPNAFPSYRIGPAAALPPYDPWSRFNGYRPPAAPSYAWPPYRRGEDRRER